MEKCPITARSLERYYHIDGNQFERQYKEHLNDYRTWSQNTVQEIRIGHRREAIQEETDAKQEVKGLKRKYIPYTFENGDTRKELLARRRHLLFKSLKSGVNHRKSEPKILFKKYSVHQKSIMSGFRDASARMQTKIPRADGIAPLPRDKNKKRGYPVLTGISSLT